MKKLVLLSPALAQALVHRLHESSIGASVLGAVVEGESVPEVEVWIEHAADSHRALEILRELVDAQTTDRCPACRYELRGHAGRATCPECGGTVRAMSPGVTCPRCGALVPGGFAVCWSCEADL